MDWYHSESGVNYLFSGSIAAAWHILPSDIQENLTDPTLMATRAFVGMRTETSPTNAVGFLSVGLIAWSYTSDLEPLEIPSVMSPDGDMDWIARWVGVVPYGAPAGFLPNPNIFDNTHLVKARRRLGNDRSLLIVFQAVDVTGHIGLDLRTLIKE
jgi:hypothetical protein